MIGEQISRVPEEVYTMVLERQRSVIRGLKGGQATELTITTKAPLVVGLGSNSPLENGFTLHPLFGIPYLPASGIKGIVRHYLEEGYCGDPMSNDVKILVAALFGTVKKGTGRIVIMDAFPAHRLSFPGHLRLDINNSHYRHYYQGQGNDFEAPGDFQDPNPVCFLTVNSGAQFKLSVFVKSPVSGQQNSRVPSDTTLAAYYSKPQTLLKDALNDMGIGGKTNVGYGWSEVGAVEYSVNGGKSK